MTPGKLSRLRPELRLVEQPAAPDGSPQWAIYDPVNGRYFQIGWMEMEMLSRWHLGEAAAICADIQSGTTLRPAADQVRELAEFLGQHNLLQGGPANGPASNWRTRFQQLSFIKIPLVRPDAALNRLSPYCTVLFTRGFWLASLGAALLSLLLVARQWDAYAGSLSGLFTAEGALWFALALILAKLIHEFGHAITARHFGLRVPEGGVALVFGWPVFYVDITEVWRLRQRQQRLIAGSAGLCAEFIAAVVATLLWVITPDGALRSALFLISSSSWLLSIAVNLNPLMKFDGYYLLSDWMGIPNLQSRGFEAFRVQLRRALLGIPPPPQQDPVTLRHGRFLPLFGACSAAYRILIVIAIGALAYLTLFKILGIAVVIALVLSMLVVPVHAELKTWWAQRGEIGTSGRWRLGVIASALLLMLALPLDPYVRAPAVLYGSPTAASYPVAPAEVLHVAVRNGQRVEAGEVLLELSSPELQHRLNLMRIRATDLALQLSRLSASELLRENRLKAEENLAEVNAQIRLLETQLEQLRVTAEIGGRVSDLSDKSRPGTWVRPQDLLLRVNAASTGRAVAYVEESQLQRLQPGDRVAVYPEAAGLRRVSGRIADIETSAVRNLDAEILAADLGGPIAVRAQQQGQRKPVAALYRIHIELEGQPVLPGQALLASATIRSEAMPAGLYFFRNAASTVMRELGF